MTAPTPPPATGRDTGEGLRELRERDARINAWLENVKPGDIVTVRLNSTDTLTGKVYEAFDDSMRTALYVWTTLLRYGNGFPGPSFEPVTTQPPAPQAGASVEARVCHCNGPCACAQWLAALTERGVLAQRDAAVRAEVGERIASAIEVEDLPRMMASEYDRIRAAVKNAARIARTIGGDR